MKILFIDSFNYPYDTTTYTKEGLGGTQTAVSCLSKELVHAGHQVAIINGVPKPIETDGVRFLNFPCPTSVLNDFDVVVPVSSIVAAKALRDVGVIRPIVLWAHHATDQPAARILQDPGERSLYKGFAMVSEWQAKNYIAAFDVNPAFVKVLRNAVSPAFLERTPAPRWFKTGAPPVLGYTSTPYRGLDILLLSFASIRRQFEGATLRVFWGVGSYNTYIQNSYASLYDMTHYLPGVTFVGTQSQTRLAEELSNIDIWSYPSTFAETSCISAMEAMASGNFLVSTVLGAIPETAAGFAHLIDLSDNRPPGTYIPPGHSATTYANHLVKAVSEAAADPQSAESKLAQQTEFARSHYRWEIRAREWTEWLESIL